MSLITIGEFSHRTRLSPKALRLYDQLGLVVPARVDAISGYRLYSAEQVESARLVGMLRRIGMPLAQISAVLAMPPGQAAAAVADYWDDQEALASERRELASYLTGKLTGQENAMHEIELSNTAERKHLIAAGTLNGLRWTAKGIADSQDFNVCWSTRGDRHDSWCDGDPLPAPAFPRVPATFYGSDVLGPAYVDLLARADVSHLLVSLRNGQTVTLRPIRVFGKERAGFAAITVPSNRSITEIQAYSANGEVGYAVPFTTPTDIETVRWLKPGQPALPKPATYTIASGRTRGQPWAERLYVGPWGFCFRNTWDGAAGSDSCVPISVSQPGGNARTLGTQDFNVRVAFSLIIGPRQLSYVVAHTGHGAPFLVRPYRVGAANFVVLATTSMAKTRWIAYSAAGLRLGSGLFYN